MCKSIYPSRIVKKNSFPSLPDASIYFKINFNSAKKTKFVKLAFFESKSQELLFLLANGENGLLKAIKYYRV